MDKNHSSPLIRFGWLRAVLFFVVWMLVLAGISVAVFFVMRKMGREFEAQTMDSDLLFVHAGIDFVAAFVTALAFRKWIDRKSFVSLGFQWKGFQHHGWTGVFLALFILSAGTLVLMGFSNVSFIGIDFVPIEFTKLIVIMVLVALAEELVIRGYILNNLLDSFPKWVSLLTTALLFSALHIFNASANWMSILGIFTGGLLLGVNYIYTRNLWYGILFHFAWNFFQGPILGYQVSGIEIESLLVHTTKGHAIWTGGPFGFEASAIACVLNMLVFGGLVFYYQKNSQGLLQQQLAVK